MAGIRIQLDGLSTLVQGLKEREEDKSAIRTVVQMNGARLQQQAQEIVPVRTGTLKRSITLTMEDGGMTANITPTAYYGAYVELGTRFMRAEPYLRPAFDSVAPQFISDLKKVMS